ncbi:hypothetical protein [Ulvibacterium marinum]|uniref:hypothetical protein n=1 Tax=Ulvibacterium marinum TaxID=2419782 RepID=UPI0024940C31|nr:hypothetical protein [Ulvibacterium marinum]
MKRLRLRNFNWKYIVGEVLLIFVGINLAIWFNDWNASKKIDQDKKIAIEKIQIEIKNNLGELRKTRQNNQRLVKAIETYKGFDSGDEDGVVVTVGQMSTFQKEFPDFLRITDSTNIADALFNYEGDVFINLELAELSKIAWETSKTTGIVNEFNYDCLYGLQGIYNLQDLVMKEMDKASNALQNQEIELLLRVLDFIRQMDSSLEKEYEAFLKRITDCI